MLREYSAEIFEEKYKLVYDSVVKDGVQRKNHCVLFLGGQPGAGKSNFYSQDNNLNHYIVIDGDKYRSYHPDYEYIIRYDLDNYAERTQGFVNECIERLIQDLSNEGYNLIIEGTLRDPRISINTCQYLVGKGYKADLYVIAADACASWQSTINRADIMMQLHETPRLVPIDKYNHIVNNLPGNLEKIEESGCFHSVHIVDRDNKILYPNMEGTSAAETLKNALNIDKWNKSYEETVNAFIDAKVEVLQSQKVSRHYGR